jgi:hypothetical protein
MTKPHRPEILPLLLFPPLQAFEQIKSSKRTEPITELSGPSPPVAAGIIGAPIGMKHFLDDKTPPTDPDD